MKGKVGDRFLRTCRTVATVVMIVSIGYQFAEGRAWEIYVFASPPVLDVAAGRTVAFEYKGHTHFVAPERLAKHMRAMWATWLGLIGAPLTYIVIAWGKERILAPMGNGERRG